MIMLHLAISVVVVILTIYLYVDSVIAHRKLLGIVRFVSDIDAIIESHQNEIDYIHGLKLLTHVKETLERKLK